MDSINARYGSRSVDFGGIHGTRNAAPTGIDFSSIPDTLSFCFKKTIAKFLPQLSYQLY